MTANCFLSRFRPLAALAIGLLACAPALAQESAAPAAEKKTEVEVTPSFREALHALFEVQGTFSSMGESIAYGAANETLMAIAGSGVEITEPMQQIVLEEAIDKFGKRIGDLDALTDILSPVYARHFSESEIAEITAFHASPIGKKSLELFPTINQEGMLAIQEVTLAITPAFQLAIDARFREVGIQITP